MRRFLAIRAVGRRRHHPDHFAAIAIPELLSARIAANEAAVAENVRTITTASMAYSLTYQNGFLPILLCWAALPAPSPLVTRRFCWIR